MKLKQIFSAALVLAVCWTQTQCGALRLLPAASKGLEATDESKETNLVRYAENGQKILNSEQLVLPWNGKGSKAIELHDDITLNPTGNTTFSSSKTGYLFTEGAVIGVSKKNVTVSVPEATPNPGPEQSPSPSTSPKPNKEIPNEGPIVVEGEGLPPDANGEPAPLSGQGGGFFASAVMGIAAGVEALGRWIFTVLGSEREFDVTRLVEERESISNEMKIQIEQLQGKFSPIGAKIKERLVQFATAHNAAVDKISSLGFGLEKVTNEQNAPPTKLKTPQDSPYFGELRKGELLLGLVSEGKPEKSRPILAAAENALLRADEYFQIGDFARGQQRLQSFENRVVGAMFPEQIPGDSGNANGATHEQQARVDAWNFGLQLANTGSELDKAGEAALADESHRLADQLLNAALSLARFSSLVDVPLTALEAFAGKTIEFENGSVTFRDVSKYERAGAVISLAVTVGATLIAGPAGTVLSAKIKDVGKQIAKEAEKKLGIEAGERIATETIKASEDVIREAESLGEFAKNWSSKPGLPDKYNAAEHAKEHLKNFPEFSNTEEYVKGAQEFIRNPPQGTIKKPRRKLGGGEYFYHEPSNTFGASDANGNPRTMFKPNDKKAYYERQF